MKPNDELLQRIARTRRKWKIFVGMRGAAWALGVMVLAALAVLWTAEKGAGYTGLAAVALFGAAALVWAVVKTVALPLWRPPTDTQIAKFVEERNPGLEDRLVSAVEAVKAPNPNHGAFSVLLVRDALERTKHVRFGEEISKRKSRGFAALAITFAIVLVLGPWVTPLFFPHANERLMAFVFDQPFNAPSLAVTPGDVTVPRGSDVRIEALLSGFDPSRATAFMRYENGKDWESATMEVIPKGQPAYRHVLYNLQETVRYYVEAGDKRSAEFRINVADLPKVEKVDYTYNYPPYTGLAPRREENGINIAALRNSTVDVVVAANQPLSGGRLLFDDGKEIVLKPTSAGGREVTGRITVDRNAKFNIELTNTSGAKFQSLDDRFMEVLDDGKPLLSFSKPGRDYSASSIEEVFTELKAEDDYGVRSMTLYYSVNGGAEKRIDLYQEKSEVSPKEMSAPHTFFLEEFSLKPGDFVSYYGKAEDSRTPSNKVTTDVYFIEVRPTDRQLTQAQAGGGGGGRGGNQDRDSIQVLLKGQKEVIAATHKLINNKDDYKGQEWTSYVHSAGAREQKLAGQTERMLDRIDNRGLDSDEAVKEIAENLKQAQAAMEDAADRLEKAKPEEAVEFEQKALIQLGRANAQYTKFQITRGGGGGGGRQEDLADDLKELADLELDQNKNQFETQQRGQQQSREQQMEEAADELKKLAERQQKAAERRQSPGAKAESQELREEIQRLARQLEKLSRETNDPKIAEVSKQLERAADNLRQQQNATSEQAAAAAGQQASEAIQRAQNMLGQNQQGGGGQAAQQFAEAERQAQRLADIQKQITNQTEQVARSPENAANRAADIDRQREALTNGLNGLGQRLNSLANAPGNRDAANQARAAANTIRDRRLPEGIEAGRQALNSGAFGAAAQQEQRNQQGINELQQQIAQAARSAAGNNPAPNSQQATEQSRLQNALDGVSQLTDRLQSLERRLQANAGAQGQPSGQQNPQGPPSGRGEQRGGNTPSQQASNPQGRSGGGQQPNPQGQPGGQPSQGSRGERGEGQGSNPSQARSEGQPNSAGSPGPVASGDATMPGANGIDPRQLSSEIGQYQKELRDIRSALGTNSPYGAQLNQIDNALRSMGNGGSPGDAKQLEILARQIIDPFRSIEFELSRQLELLTNRERLRAAREEDIPASMKDVIGNYFERIGKSKP